MHYFWRWLLSPLFLVYYGLYKLWSLHAGWPVPYVSKPYVSNKWVVSVGNLSVGGSGKTPLVMFLLDFFHTQGWACAVLSRGYKAKRKQHLQVVEAKSADWSSAGDEAFLIKNTFPKAAVYVCKNRSLAAKAAEQQADVLIMDDGFQHRKLARDLDIVLIDALPALPDDYLLPLGALREPWSALKRADAVVITKSNLVPAVVLNQKLNKAKKYISSSTPVFQAELHASGLYSPQKQLWHAPEMLAGQPCILCCAVGNPLGFEGLVQQLGARIEARLFLPDHCSYEQNELEKIQKLKQQFPAAWVIVTAKDWVKLSDFKLEDFWVLHVQLELPPKFLKFLKNKLDTKIKKTLA